MKNFALSLGIVLSLLSHPVYAEYDFTPAEDKLYHLGGSAAIGFGANYLMGDWRYAFGACAAIGAAKEIYDEDDYGGASVEDFAYDVVGCAIGVGMSEALGVRMAVIPERNLDGLMLAVQYGF
ncbi:hypothetical protein L3Q72_14900 [Vibrio sp. JC009]|uniref:hypothetical protein n=1 Tax=Vibrio sp. JC009 TaxID=2912314 RepID=UPI0023AFE78D|nr:hypothetical protein [Vibrio sp. JC009]WED24171.1 hypothetical protein L3Q72_14900 [Vibrio sp. JC009]